MITTPGAATATVWAEVRLPGGQTVSNRMGDWVVGGRVLEPLPPLAGASAEEKEARQAENRARPRVESFSSWVAR